MTHHVDVITQEIDLGAIICKKIKYIYFPDEHWHKCCYQVANKFTLFKKILRAFYGMDKNQNLELLKKVSNFDEIDIEDVFAMEAELLKDDMDGKSKTQNEVYGKKVTWVPIPIDKPELMSQVKALLGKEPDILLGDKEDGELCAQG